MNQAQKEDAMDKLESAIDTLIEINNGVTHEMIQQTIADLRVIADYIMDRKSKGTPEEIS